MGYSILLCPLDTPPTPQTSWKSKATADFHTKRISSVWLRNLRVSDSGEGTLGFQTLPPLPRVPAEVSSSRPPGRKGPLWELKRSW